MQQECSRNEDGRHQHRLRSLGQCLQDISDIDVTTHWYFHGRVEWGARLVSLSVLYSHRCLMPQPENFHMRHTNSGVTCRVKMLIDQLELPPRIPSCAGGENAHKHLNRLWIFRWNQKIHIPSFTGFHVRPKLLNGVDIA